MIIDTHTHVVGDEQTYPFSPRQLSGEWYREAPCSAAQLIEAMDGAGVDRAVLVQPVGAYSFDNRYAADSAAAHPGRFASACCVDPNGDHPDRELDHWLGTRGMQGVRLFALSGGEQWLSDAAAPLWRRAADLGAHIIVTVLATQLADLGRVLRRFPSVPVSLDHAGFPDPANPEPLFALSEIGNLHLKVTTHMLDSATQADGDPAPFVTRVVERFGPERVMWGSDFCQIRDRPYDELVELARRGFDGLASKAREACLAGTALRLWPAFAQVSPGSSNGVQ